MQSHSHRFRSCLQAGSNLVVAQLFDFSHQEHYTQTCREAVNGSLQVCVQFTLLKNLFRSPLRVGRIERRFLRQSRQGGGGQLFLFQEVQCLVDGDALQPGRELAVTVELG